MSIRRPRIRRFACSILAKSEWTPAMTIASTTVPWALDWLACYELWLMTGRWTGGGRHAGSEFAEVTEIRPNELYSAAPIRRHDPDMLA